MIHDTIQFIALNDLRNDFDFDYYYYYYKAYDFFLENDIWSGSGFHRKF